MGMGGEQDMRRIVYEKVWRQRGLGKPAWPQPNGHLMMGNYGQPDACVWRSIGKKKSVTAGRGRTSL